MNNNSFKTRMLNLKNDLTKYVNGEVSSFSMERGHSYPVSQDNPNPNGREEAQLLIDLMEAKIQEDVHNAATAANDGKMELEIAQENGENRDKALSDFRKRMNERKEQMKEAAVLRIEKAFDNLIEVGEKYPSTQNFIENGIDFLSKLFAKIWDKISGFFKDFKELISRTFAKIEEWVSGAANFIWSWLTGNSPDYYSLHGIYVYKS